jgi:hypothetical protein
MAAPKIPYLFSFHMLPVIGENTQARYILYDTSGVFDFITTIANLRNCIILCDFFVDIAEFEGKGNSL